MRTVYESRTAHERRMAQKRRLRREFAAISDRPVETVHERWLDAEAVDAALALADYFHSPEYKKGYGHAANIAAAGRR